MTSSLLTQIKQVLSDQEQSLKEVREARRGLVTQTLTELDAKEIEIINGIKQTKKIIEELQAEAGITELP